MKTSDFEQLKFDIEVFQNLRVTPNLTGVTFTEEQWKELINLVLETERSLHIKFNNSMDFKEVHTVSRALLNFIKWKENVLLPRKPLKQNNMSYTVKINPEQKKKVLLAKDTKIGDIMKIVDGTDSRKGTILLNIFTGFVDVCNPIHTYCKECPFEVELLPSGTEIVLTVK